jgi:hypothetical protein
MAPGDGTQPKQETRGWRLWISSTGRHWAIRCGILPAANIAAGARPLLWAENSAGLAALIRAQEELADRLQSAGSSDCSPGHSDAASLGRMPGQN